MWSPEYSCGTSASYLTGVVSFCLLGVQQAEAGVGRGVGRPGRRVDSCCPSLTRLGLPCMDGLGCVLPKRLPPSVADENDNTSRYADWLLFCITQTVTPMWKKAIIFIENWRWRGHVSRSLIADRTVPPPATFFSCRPVL